MRAMVVVVVLPLLELVVEHLRVVDHRSVEQAVELLGVDAVRPLHFAVQPRRARLDVAVADALVEQVVVEGRAEIRPVEFLTGVKPRRS